MNIHGNVQVKSVLFYIIIYKIILRNNVKFIMKFTYFRFNNVFGKQENLKFLFKLNERFFHFLFCTKFVSAVCRQTNLKIKIMS